MRNTGCLFILRVSERNVSQKYWFLCFNPINDDKLNEKDTFLLFANRGGSDGDVNFSGSSCHLSLRNQKTLNMLGVHENSYLFTMIDLKLLKEEIKQD